MACEVTTLKECIMQGDSAYDRAIDFSIDIANMHFFYETRDFKGDVVERKVLGNGLDIIPSSNRLIVQMGIETKAPSVYASALKCVDGNEVTTILAWETTVTKKMVEG